MKKVLMIFIFIFMTGLFAGLFFSTNLSEENSSGLSGLLLASFDPVCEIPAAFVYVLISNMALTAVMVPAVFSKYLSPLPPLVLLFKSFTIGFCCGLVYVSTPDNPFLLSFVKLFPQNIFFIPAFILMAVVTFCISTSGSPTGQLSRKSGMSHRHSSVAALLPSHKNRLPKSGNPLIYILITATALILAGSLTEALLHQVVL
ncbi:MAG: hypothetical protein GX663_02295 [Clostridiales bacterium]|nr:hypothetical protein [Clostridiales bacterium]